MNTYKAEKIGRSRKQIIMVAGFLAVLAAGWRYPLLGFFIPLCMLLGIGIGLYRGRKWCDWLCPRGSAYDVLIKPLSPSRNIPGLLRSLPVRIGFMAFLMAVMAWQLAVRWPDLNRIGQFFVIMLSATTVLGLLLALVLHQRTWCYICPIGSMANWVGRGTFPLRIDSQLCNECGACLKVCPVGIAPFKFKGAAVEIVRAGDCLKCGLCVAACPKQALSLKGESALNPAPPPAPAACRR